MKMLIAAASLLAPMLAHADCKDMMSAWAEELHPGRVLDSQRSECQTWPANPQLTLAALSLAHDADNDDAGATDLEVLVADTASGAIVAHLFQRNAINHDAERFSDIALDTARYQLTPTSRAFGVRVSHEGTERMIPKGATSLSLYVLEGANVRPVLDSLIVEEATGAWDLRCTGAYDVTKRTIAIGPAGHDGYASLKITEKRVHTVTRMAKNECVKKDGRPKQSAYTLEYRNGQYSVPEGMQRPG
ncbi:MULTISPECIES: hypothetical protein [unclassified Caballeronia]|uniref:hypothetical protein n=1 Tax=unclassified Caballeronia TaxID=2646786 RepID=UPI002863E667|nr:MULTISPECIES: hypothetical protein [unclassified Caballeronia]MDR5740847.1 hypothetical protein [Caballeronia sp. LZ016]MDR5808632.1 hypothetical protein [Caballeronia sp. LZ019]